MNLSLSCEILLSVVFVNFRKGHQWQRRRWKEEELNWGLSLYMNYIEWRGFVIRYFQLVIHIMADMQEIRLGKLFYLLIRLTNKQGVRKSLTQSFTFVNCLAHLILVGSSFSIWCRFICNMGCRPEGHPCRPS